MADTSLTLSGVRTKLYNELGSPAADLPNTSSGILDDQIEFASRRILSQIAVRRRGEDALIDSFTTVADQQTYAVPDDRQIVEVFWGPSGDVDIPIDPYARQFGQIPGSSLAARSGGYYWRSDQVIADIKRKQILSRYMWEVLSGDIYLYPVPTSAETVKYLYFKEDGDVTDLDLAHEHAVIMLAAAYCSRIMANRMRGQGTPFTQQGITESGAASDWDLRYAQYLESYHIEIQEFIG